jgi:4-cresol dehydrogenase (hydroxylating)
VAAVAPAGLRDPPRRVRRAIAAWAGAIGSAHVLTAPGAVGAMERATFATGSRVPAILRPGDRAEVRECLLIANRFRAPLYPISAGRNWGYGSAVPPRDHTTVLDLGRLDRIVDHDEALGYVTVEPGVTVGRLQRFLDERGSLLQVEGSGPTPDASLVGNALERGIRLGPAPDHFGSVCALEVLAPTGQRLRTGFGRFEGARAAKVSRYGLGPYIDGLFTQAGLGVVVEMTLWLERRRSHHAHALFEIAEPDGLPALVDGLRAIRQRSLPAYSLKLFNAGRVLAMIIGGGHSPGGPGFVGSPMLLKAAGALGIGAWAGIASVGADSSDEIARWRAAFEQALSGRADRLGFVGGDFVSAELPRLRREAPWFALATSNADDQLALKTLYRMKGGVPAGRPLDPDADGCGVIWCAPAMPFDGRTVQGAAAIVQDVCDSNGFESDMAVTGMSERLLVMVSGLFFDRARRDDDERAMACHRALVRRLASEGFYAYRLSLPDMTEFPWPRDGYGEVLRTLKGALDPRGVLAPGRYEVFR